MIGLLLAASLLVGPLQDDIQAGLIDQVAAILQQPGDERSPPEAAAPRPHVIGRPAPARALDLAPGPTGTPGSALTA